MSRPSLAILAAFFALFAAIMWLSVAGRLDDPFAVRRMYFALGISLAALGAAAGALDPSRYSWGRRLLALVGGASLGLLAATLQVMSKTAPDILSVIASLAIFFGFSLPLLMFALWGSIWGPLDRIDKPPREISASDILLLRIRIFSSFVVAILYGTYFVYLALRYFDVLG
jgi:hypothetical protein